MGHNGCGGISVVCGNGCGSSISVSSNRCDSMSISSNRGSMSNSNSGLVDGDVVLVNHGGLDDLLDGVDLVGFGNGDGVRNLDGVGFGNMFFNNDLPFDRDGNSNGYFDFVFVHLKLGFDSLDLGSDSGVGADRCGDLLDGNGISGGGALVGGCGRDGSIWCRCGRDGGRSNGDGGLAGLGGSSLVGVGGGLVDRLFLGVGVADLDGLRSNLDGTVSNNFLVSGVISGSRDNVFMDLGTNNGGGVVGDGVAVVQRGANCHGGGNMTGLGHGH